MQRRDAASQRPRKARILRPHTVFSPHFRAGRAGRLVAVAVRLHARAGIDAQVAVNVDDAGGDIFALRLDQRRAHGHGNAGADLGNLAAFQPYHAIVDAAPGAVIDGGPADHRHLAGIGPVLAWPGVLAHAHHVGRGGGCVLRLVLCGGDRGQRHTGDAQQQNSPHVQSTPLLAPRWANRHASANYPTATISRRASGA